MSLGSLDYVNVLSVQITGRNGLGSISVPGTKVGDSVLVQSGPSFIAPGSADSFETAISVADEIQQVSTADLTTNTFNIILLRPM